jgi:hypothetical protein
VDLSLHPDDASASNSWGNALHLFASPLEVSAGDRLELTYRFDGTSQVELRAAR